MQHYTGLTFPLESEANAMWDIADKPEKKENSSFSVGPGFVKSQETCC